MSGSGLGEDMQYKEELPAQCPPAEALDGEILEAYRVVYSSPPVAHDFLSKSALGNDLLPGMDPCCFASCSLNESVQNVVRIAQLPKPREKGALVAKISIPAGAGRWVKNKRKHIDFWMYEGYDPTSSFVEMVEF